MVVARAVGKGAQPMPNQIQLAAAAAHPTEPPSVETLYPDEVKRWLLTVGLPMLAACVCIGLAFGTSFRWFYGGAIAFGPGIGVLAIIYLAISSDTNGTATPTPAAESVAQSELAVASVAA